MDWLDRLVNCSQIKYRYSTINSKKNCLAHHEGHNIVPGIGLASQTRPTTTRQLCVILVLNLLVHLNWNELAPPPQCHGEHKTDGNGLNVATEPP